MEGAMDGKEVRRGNLLLSKTLLKKERQCNPNELSGFGVVTGR